MVLPDVGRLAITGINTSGMGRRVVGRRLLSPAACDIRDLAASEWSPNSVHSSIAGRSRLHRRMAQICRHISLLDTRHRFDRRVRTASLQPVYECVIQPRTSNSP